MHTEQTYTQPKKPTPHTFHVDNGNHQSTGCFLACIPISHGSFLAFKTYKVPIDVPFLFAIDVLDDFGLCLDIEDICSNNRQWKIPINFQDGHAYIKHNKTQFTWYYTKQEILRLQQHFMHPSAGKLYSLLPIADPKKPLPRYKNLWNTSPKTVHRARVSQYHHLDSDPPTYHMKSSPIGKLHFI